MKTLLSSLAILGTLASAAQAQIYLSEDFSYSNGRLVDNSAGSWTIHSTGASPLNVTGGAAIINQGDGTSGHEDALHLLKSAGSPVTFVPDGNGSSTDNLLFAKFTVKFDALPSGTTGSYFAHFATDSATPPTVFYDRIGASTANAAAGSFRIGVGNGTWAATSAQFPQDLQVGVKYTVVTGFNLDTKVGTLWVNPTTEASTSVVGIDTIATFTGKINAFALRQGTTGTPTQGPGIIEVDNLVVGRSFTDVTAVPEPASTAAVVGLGLAGFSLWRRRQAKA